MTKLLKVTVDLITASTIEDVYVALASLSPIKQTTSIDELPNDKHKSKGVRGPYKKSKRGHIRDHVTFKRPRKYTDARLVWDKHLNHVDVEASLKNVGMTREQIDKMVTKQGSIEHTIKRAMRGRGY